MIYHIVSDGWRSCSKAFVSERYRNPRTVRDGKDHQYGNEDREIDACELYN